MLFSSACVNAQKTKNWLSFCCLRVSLCSAGRRCEVRSNFSSGVITAAAEQQSYAEQNASKHASSGEFIKVNSSTAGRVQKPSEASEEISRRSLAQNPPFSLCVTASLVIEKIGSANHPKGSVTSRMLYGRCILDVCPKIRISTAVTLVVCAQCAEHCHKLLA